MHYYFPSRRSNHLAKQATQLAIAAPQVIQARVSRFMKAGVNPSEQDQHEFYTMGAEKWWAFSTAGLAMSYEMAKQNQKLMSSFFNPFTGLSPFKPLSTAVLQNNFLDVINKGLEPIRKTAIANAKRLQK